MMKRSVISSILRVLIAVALLLLLSVNQFLSISAKDTKYLDFNEINKNFVTNDRLIASFPAKWIDDLLLYSPEFGTTKSLTKVGARGLSLTISVSIFPAFLAFDVLVHSKNIVEYRVLSFISSAPDVKEKYSDEAKKSEQVLRRCLRGIATFPAGIIWRDIVSHHYLPEKKEDGRIHPKGGLYVGDAEIDFPLNEREVQKLVLDAKKSGRKVSIAGSGFCQGKQTLTGNKKDIHLNMTRINHVEIDSVEKTAIVGAGATWSQIQNKGDKHGLAVLVMQASNVFSVGGSLSANCHGWDHHQGCLINTVNWIRVVDTEGNIQKLKPEDELFQCVIGGYGLFGVIVEAQIKLTDNEELFDFSQRVEIKDYHQFFTEQVASNPNIKMHLYRLSLEPGKLMREGWSQSYSSLTQKGITGELEDEVEKGSVMDRVLLQIGRNSPFAREIWWKQERKNLQKIQKGTRNAFMRPKINSVFVNQSNARAEWLQEYFVPGEKLADYLKFLSELLNENEVVLMNASIRFVCQDELSNMSYAKDGDRFAIVLFFSQSLNENEIKKTENWVQKAIDKLSTIEGTFYLPYMHFATQEQFRQCYSQWKDVEHMKQKFDSNLIFDNGLFQDYFSEQHKNKRIGLPSKAVYETFVDSEKLRDFLENVFKQVDTDKFMQFYQEAVEKETPRQIYEALLNGANEAKGGLFSKLSAGLNALDGERSTLANNVEKLMDPNRPKNGYVEIGMPGRMIKAIRPLTGLNGRVIVVNENEDLIQSGFPRPYDAYYKLTYNPLPVEEQSVDVISCFPGLHHCPEGKLDTFIQSIFQSLRDGGIFLLREHDANDEEMFNLATIVHSVFNACTGVELQDEIIEVRNFKSVAEWVRLLESHGFRYVSEVPLIRAGDSSKNALMKFVKSGNQLGVLREEMISESNHYTRRVENTHLTTVEWFNVESSQNLGQYECFWDYPYFRDLSQLWRVFFNSWSCARDMQNFNEVAFSDYSMTNYMILTMMTAEYSVKGVLYLPIWALSKGEQLLPESEGDQNWKNLANAYQRWFQDYGERLEVTPHYAQEYKPFIGEYWREFAQVWNKLREKRSFFNAAFDRYTMKNLITGVAMSADLLSRAMISTSINWMVGGEENGDNRDIAMIVREGEGYRSVIGPRYKEFGESLMNLVDQGSDIVEIAGQTEIQIDFILDKDDGRLNYVQLYDRVYLPGSDKKIVAVRVRIDEMDHYFKTYDVHRIYDY